MADAASSPVSVPAPPPPAPGELPPEEREAAFVAVLAALEALLVARRPLEGALRNVRRL